MEDRAALQRARVMAGYQRQAAVDRYGYQKGIIDYRNENPPPEKPRAVGVADQLWDGDGVTSGGTSGAATAPPPPPPAASPAAPSTGGQPANTDILPVTGDLPPTNTGEMSTDMGARLLQQGVIPEPPPFSDASGGDASGRVVVGEGDGPDDVLLYNQNDVEAPIQAVRKYIPGTGWAVTKKVTPEGRSIDVVNDAATPTDPPQPGHMYVAEVPNEYTGRYGGWKQVPITPALVEERKAVVKNFVATDPGIASLRMNAAASKAQVDAATAGLKSLPEGDQPGQQGPAAKALVDQATAAAVATASADAAEAQMNLDLTIGGEEALLAAYNNRVVNQRANAIPQQGTGEAWAGNEEALLRTPAPPQTVPTAAPSVREQLAQQTEGPQRQVWDQEKRFAIQEAKSLALRLGLRENALIDAFEKNDRDSINLIRKTAAERGVVSPLFTESMTVLPVPSVRPGFGSPGRPVASPARGWARSNKLGRTYGEVLRAAAQDPNYKSFRGETRTKRGYSIEPLVETK
jgi:hypothetical protein